MRNAYSRMWLIGQSALIYFWCTNLVGTDSFYSLYLLCAIAGMACLWNNDPSWIPLNRGRKTALTIAAACFSLSAVLANYKLFQPYTALLNGLNLVLCLVGGFVTAWNFLAWALNQLPLVVKKQENTHPARLFFLTFLAMTLINLSYLLLCKYPGVAPYDTISQMSQVMGLSPWSNWTPYWHTWTIKVFYNLGFALFGDVNAAVACFSGVQAVFAAACFAYVLVTLYQIGMPKGILGAVFFLYALLPYNIVFSVTIGKDVLFGLGLLLMLTAFCRILLGVGRSGFLNGIFFAVGSLGFCLWRTNGWPVYAVFALMMAVFLWRTHRKWLWTMSAVALTGWFLLNPFLQAREIPNGSINEALAVPFQQVARVIVNERPLREEEETLLSEIFDLEAVKELYDPIRVDPIKFDAFRHSHEEYFKENLVTYGKLWLKLGLKYPGDYLEAWVDQTKGFWHGGYDMGVYDKDFPANELGIENRTGEGIAAKAFLLYFRLFERPAGLEFFKSIGFTVWLVLVCVFLNLVQGRRQGLLAVPVLLLLAILWVGTPVYAEFRYAYPVFVTVPLILFTTIAEPRRW